MKDNYTGTRAFEQIAPLTTRNFGTRERGRPRYQRNYYSNNNVSTENQINDLEYELSNMSIYERQKKQLELNNMSGTFSGGIRKDNNNSFGGSFQLKGECFNCKKEGHWANNCPLKQQRNTKAMTRSRSRNRKGQDRITKNNKSRNWKSSDIKPITNDYTSPRMRAINRHRSRSRSKSRDRSYNRRRDNHGRFVSNLEYEEEYDGYDGNYDNNYNDNNYNKNWDYDNRSNGQNYNRYDHQDNYDNYEIQNIGGSESDIDDDDQYANERIYDEYEYETGDDNDDY